MFIHRMIISSVSLRSDPSGFGRAKWHATVKAQIILTSNLPMATAANIKADSSLEVLQVDGVVFVCFFTFNTVTCISGSWHLSWTWLKFRFFPATHEDSLQLTKSVGNPWNSMVFPSGPGGDLRGGRCGELPTGRCERWSWTLRDPHKTWDFSAIAIEHPRNLLRGFLFRH